MRVIKKYIKEQRDRLSNVDSVYKMTSEFLERDLAYPNGANIKNIATSIGRFATYNGAQGLLDIQDGKDTGWELVSKSLYGNYWVMRINTGFYTKREFKGERFEDGGLTNDLPICANLLAAFIALDESELAKSTYDMLCFLMFKKGVVNTDNLDASTFEPFMVWLYGQYAGTQVPDALKNHKFGVYQAIMDAWQEPETMKQALVDVKAYHYTEVLTKGEWDRTFEEEPFCLLLFEIFAIIKVFKAHGRDTDSLKVTLPDTPYGNINKIKLVKSETLGKVETGLRDVLESLKRP